MARPPSQWVPTLESFKEREVEALESIALSLAALAVILSENSSGGMWQDAWNRYLKETKNGG